MFNLVVLIGNLGADPEIRTTPSGIKVAKMRLAVNDVWTNRSTGEKEQKTHWVDLNAWDRLAQTAEKFLTRGQRIAIRGTLEYREWTAQDGVKRSKLEVRVRELIMLSGKEQPASSKPRLSASTDSKGYSSYQREDRPPEADNRKPDIEQESDNHGMTSDYSDYDSPVEDDDIPF